MVRVVRLGFEVRAEITVDGSDAWVQITRDTADRLTLESGRAVFVRAIPGAPTPRTPYIEAKAPIEPSLQT